MESVAIVLAQALAALLVSPFVVGLIRKVKARLQCRRGASILQPYSDLWKLFQKDVVVSTNTSWIFTTTPYILFVVTLAETGRVPVDNPATHLELTMIHEAMVLEYSGRYLALIEWASALKLLLFLTLLSNIFAPWGIATETTPAWMALGMIVWLIKV